VLIANRSTRYWAGTRLLSHHNTLYLRLWRNNKAQTKKLKLTHIIKKRSGNEDSKQSWLPYILARFRGKSIYVVYIQAFSLCVCVCTYTPFIYSSGPICSRLIREHCCKRKRCSFQKTKLGKKCYFCSYHAWVLVQVNFLSHLFRHNRNITTIMTASVLHNLHALSV
jgi:hypothetical protein